MVGGTLWNLPISVEDLAHKEVGSWSNTDNRAVLSDSAAMPSEMEQTKYVEKLFISPDWLFWQLLPNSRIIFPFWENFQHGTSLGSLSLINE